MRLIRHVARDLLSMTRAATNMLCALTFAVPAGSLSLRLAASRSAAVSMIFPSDLGGSINAAAAAARRQAGNAQPDFGTLSIQCRHQKHGHDLSAAPECCAYALRRCHE